METGAGVLNAHARTATSSTCSSRCCGSRPAGYEDVNDAERLCVDPALCHVVGGRTSQPDKQAAPSSEVGRFETETLSSRRNLTVLMNLSGRWVDNVHR
jgi:hypothetical protein